jgi:translation initiation factor IF-2
MTPAFNPQFLTSALQYSPQPGPNLSFNGPGMPGLPPVPPTGGPAPAPQGAPSGPNPAPPSPPRPLPGTGSPLNAANQFTPFQHGEAMSYADKVAQAKATGVSMDFDHFLKSALLGSTITGPLGPFKAGAALGADALAGGSDVQDLGSGNYNSMKGWGSNFDRLAKAMPKAPPQRLLDLTVALTKAGSLTPPHAPAPKRPAAPQARGAGPGAGGAGPSNRGGGAQSGKSSDRGRGGMRDGGGGYRA